MKTGTDLHLSIQPLRCLITNIQHIPQAFLTANQKLGYTKLGSGYLYEVQLYGTILLKIHLNLALFKAKVKK